MDNLILTNARLPGMSGLHQISIEHGAIAAIQRQPYATLTNTPLLIDMAGDWVSLGGLDLQINGALGLAFPDLNPANVSKLNAIGQFLWQQGVNAYLPTLVTTSIAAIQRSLATLASFAPASNSDQAVPLGVHLEGPFLNPEKRGAHPLEHLLPLTLEGVKQVLGDYAPLVKVITLAPELDATGQVIPYLRSLGITVSLGHSLATAAQTQQAFDQGARMVTHAFNAMPPLHHREPGLLGAAICHPLVRCGLIADGHHVDPLMMQILLRAAQSDQGIFLVSDALSPLGLPDGNYPWDTRQITVTQGTARMQDGTLAGTTLPLLVAAQNLVKWKICEAETAIALATTAPRQAIELPIDYVGQPAQLLRWQQPSPGELTWSRISPMQLANQLCPPG